MSWLNLLTNGLGAGVPNLPIHLLNIICKLWQVLGNFGFSISQQDLKNVQFSEQFHSPNCSSFSVRFVRVSFLDWPIFHNFNRSNRSKCRRSLLVAFYWIARGKNNTEVGRFWINCQRREKNLHIFGLSYHRNQTKKDNCIKEFTHKCCVLAVHALHFYHILPNINNWDGVLTYWS